MSAVKIFAFLDLNEKSWFSFGHYLGRERKEGLFVQELFRLIPLPWFRYKRTGVRLGLVPLFNQQIGRFADKLLTLIFILLNWN